MAEWVAAEHTPRILGAARFVLLAGLRVGRPTTFVFPPISLGSGRPVQGLLCSFGDGTGLVTQPDGTCRYPGAAATEATVRLKGGTDSEGSSYVAGSATFTVVANDLTIVRIVVDEP